jgi:hypothetical protein
VLSTVPLALSVPGAVAGLAYLNARAALFYDWQTIGSGIAAQVRCALKEKGDRLNAFYVLEEHAKGKLANNAFLIFEGEKWTYKETYEMALKYGTWFKTRYGIKSKEIVAMDFMNSEKFIFVWFGLWASEYSLSQYYSIITFSACFGSPIRPPNKILLLTSPLPSFTIRKK